MSEPYIPFHKTKPLKIIDDQQPEGQKMDDGPGYYDPKEEKKESPLTNYPIWFHRDDPKNRTDGVLYVPFETAMEGQVSQKNICWYFIMDMSGSMDTHVSDKNLTRWEVSVKLLDQAINDLQKLHRKNDTLTIITFSGQAQIIMDSVPVEQYNSQLIHDITPQGYTDISRVNSTTYESMMNNKLLTQKDYLAVEIFFTDGEATIGITDTNLLKQQKASLYTNLQKSMNGDYPFFWCGGISTDADLKVIRALSSASPHSLWAYIKDEQTENFAAEIGGVITMVTSMKMLTLPIAKVVSPTQIVETKTIMLIPDIPNVFYFKFKPVFAMNQQVITVGAEQFVSLYKMSEIIYQHTRGALELKKSDLDDILKRAQNRSIDKSLENSPWQPLFEKTQQTVYDNIELLKQDGQQETQISQHRGAYMTSNTIQTASQKYRNIYSQFDS